MSVTRLVVLGAVRIFQPTHGYFVRRELTTWQVADWAHLNPGSVYNALRALTKENMLLEEPSEDPATSSRSRMLYRLTVDGEQEFQRLVREALWQLHIYEPGWLLAGLSFWPALSREEVVAALTARTSLLRARIAEYGFAVAELPGSATGTPPHIVEHFRIGVGQLQAELDWAEAAVGRIEAGAYGFRDEDPRWYNPATNPLAPPRTP
jgi:DNA-binding PadR family transcriptional regulator